MAERQVSNTSIQTTNTELLTPDQIADAEQHLSVIIQRQRAYENIAVILTAFRQSYGQLQQHNNELSQLQHQIDDKKTELAKVEENIQHSLNKYDADLKAANAEAEKQLDKQFASRRAELRDIQKQYHTEQTALKQLQDRLKIEEAQRQQELEEHNALLAELIQQEEAIKSVINRAQRSISV